MRPRWMRRNVACPECGLIYPTDHELQCASTHDEKHRPIAVDCPVCKCHYTWDDFWAEQSDKWSREHKPE